ncbi:peptidase U32 family protein [Megalodesulfovibrio gigas]|uniref:Putative peptidase U32 n=1 Tax=Megalodesulfovibrio gigas (strain ATCC 19364 / DSM 1382 / NCIMB 9332 / VKM B-1759) TaxID=1121448 RepID=T2GEL3_MEGG1|nr:peptidase U32 family protein [Megalodesulfovibrio gigas]AGW14367.1 putative peptidase U32 [Megalodesulfovibrio gigas DSM 1382 = ATCC 19364]
MTLRIPELLAPAGGPEQLEAALLYGADAVYLSGPDLSLRAGSRGFAGPALAEAGRLVHRLGKRYYYCLNLLARDADLPAVAARLEALAAMEDDARPDGVIVADPGVMRLARRLAPALPVHVSTQANTTNTQTLAVWKDQGATRANLARELPGPAIASLAAAARDLELETECFVHGAQCLAVSGRCLLSMALNRRHANLGRCTHPCRFDYRVATVEEKTRPGEALWELEALDEQYAAFFSCEDLCLLPYLGWFAWRGVDALKLEGRTRSAGALAPVVDVYATALAGLRHGRLPHGRQLQELLAATARPLGTGFFLGERLRIWQDDTAHRRPIAARLETRLGEDTWRMAVRDRLDAAAPLELLLPGLQRPCLAPGSFHLETEAGEYRTTAHSGTTMRLRLEASALATPLQPGLYLRQGAVTASAQQAEC